jgi:hypothetical protein
VTWLAIEIVKAHLASHVMQLIYGGRIFAAQNICQSLDHAAFSLSIDSRNEGAARWPEMKEIHIAQNPSVDIGNI